MEFLSVILDSLLIVLVIILIILSLKALDTLNKLDAILEHAKKKLESLDSIFTFIDVVDDKLTIVTDTIISSIVSFISGIFKKKKEEDIDE